MIEWSNIDLDKRLLKFWERKKHRFWEVPLTLEVTQELKRLLDVKDRLAMTKKQKKNPKKYLFTFSGKTAYNKLQRYLKKIGIEKEISFHDLRRSFTKTARKKGLEKKAVAQILGDKESTVELYYANLDNEELRDEVDKL